MRKFPSRPVNWNIFLVYTKHTILIIASAHFMMKDLAQFFTWWKKNLDTCIECFLWARSFTHFILFNIQQLTTRSSCFPDEEASMFLSSIAGIWTLICMVWKPLLFLIPQVSSFPVGLQALCFLNSLNVKIYSLNIFMYITKSKGNFPWRWWR